MELALSQLAQTMGLSLPGFSLIGEPSNHRTNAKTSFDGDDANKKSLPDDAPLSPEAEEEEGEVSEEENTSPAVPTIITTKPRQAEIKRVTRPSAAPDFTGEVDAESLLRGGARKRSAPNKLMKNVTKDVALNSKQDNKPNEAVKPKPRVPCRYFMEGKCSKGDECTFSHALRPNKTTEEARSEEVCRFHMAGNCLKGEGCMYSHDLSKVPCKFFHAKGECAAGDSCRFSHAPVSEDIRHQLFVEMTGVRDPRLSGLSAPERPTVQHSNLSPSAPPVTGNPWIPSIIMHPAVAIYNPFGSPF